MSASCRTIFFSFEAVRGEYLSRTQRATQRAAILSILCKWKYTVSRTYGACIGYTMSMRGYRLGRCSQHRGGEPERAKGADGMQLFALDCIAYIVDAETDRVFACMNGM